MKSSLYRAKLAVVLVFQAPFLTIRISDSTFELSDYWYSRRPHVERIGILGALRLRQDIGTLGARYNKFQKYSKNVFT
jgi:hypothetical protein